MIDGKKISQQIIDNIASKCANLNFRPGLAVILIGHDPASKIYIKLKKKACQEAGIDFHSYFFAQDTQQEKIIETIEFLNNDPEINAILVQLPLPKGYDTDKIIQSIDSKKDVDGFHKTNLENFLHDKPAIASGLCMGIIELLKSTKQQIKNKKTLIICNSKIFGIPLEKMLKDLGAEPKTILSTEKNITQKTLNSDIIIIAVGKPNFLTADMIKEKSIIIDVGINKLNDKTVGDANFKEISKKTEFITPVPGGVGPMCVAMLLENVLNCCKLQKKF